MFNTTCLKPYLRDGDPAFRAHLNAELGYIFDNSFYRTFRRLASYLKHLD